MKAKRQFNKYAAPLLHVSGLHVTIVESEYQGQMRTLMNYIDPHVDRIVVAGGDGTLLEVLNGLMRRKDAMQLNNSVTFGIIPLGKENRFYTSHYLQEPSSKIPARMIGEATMAVIRGHTGPVHIMELQPEKGRTLYATSSVHWGVFKEANENKDSYWLFGPLRLFFSCLSVATRRWPLNSYLHLWLPPHLAAHSATPSPPDDSHLQYKSHDRHMTASSSSSSTTLARWLGVSYSSCISSPPLALGKSSVTEGKEPHSANSSLSGRPGWSHRKLDCTGFNLLLDHKSQQVPSLSLTVWPSSLAKSSFLNYGLSRGEMNNIPCEVFKSPEFSVQPNCNNRLWLSVDGESYEPMSFAVKLLPNAVKFCMWFKWIIIIDCLPQVRVAGGIHCYNNHDTHTHKVNFVSTIRTHNYKITNEAH